MARLERKDPRQNNLHKIPRLGRYLVGSRNFKNIHEAKTEVQ